MTLYCISGIKDWYDLLNTSFADTDISATFLKVTGNVKPLEI